MSENENRLGQAGQIGQTPDVIESRPISLQVTPQPQNQRPEWMDATVPVMKKGTIVEVPIGIWLRDSISPHTRGT